MTSSYIVTSLGLGSLYVCSYREVQTLTIIIYYRAGVQTPVSIVLLFVHTLFLGLVLYNYPYLSHLKMLIHWDVCIIMDTYLLKLRSPH